MRSRKVFAVLGTGLVLAGCLTLYLMMDLTLFPQDNQPKFPVKDNQWLHLESRLAKLEKDFDEQYAVLNQLQKVARSRNSGSLPANEQHRNETSRKNSNRHHIFPERVSRQTCSFDPKKIPDVDVQMLDLYKDITFDNPDGGVWKQGWKITYNEKQWHPNRKLRVFVVPHSHNDPGWLKTFEKYYETETKNILNNMVVKLAENSRRKFIWAEVSYFQLWWDNQSEATKQITKDLIHDRQLEIVAGGWVMPDEANSHWVAQLTQLTEGHQWLKKHLDVLPKSGWAIDPFGLSPTMPYLLKAAGLSNTLIQRAHYSVKKRLAREKSLEFRWRQLWDTDGSSEFFTHLMPFYSYDVPHTCGPDPKVCCQFDFKRLPSYGPTCPWRIAPQVITDSNVANRSELLLDQYRKKAQLFRTNVVLVPLGDDFRYNHVTEWNAQYDNYQKLFDYMNSKAHLNVDIQFGTLSDYFDAVRQEQKIEQFPSLSGDFFTYADRDDHYWSGYYTSRPFHKRLDRVLLGSLRGSEVLAAIGWVQGIDQLANQNIADRLTRARRWHSLFQHHDGVTGTAKDNVVVDYALKMISALEESEYVLQQSAMYLLRNHKDVAVTPDATYFKLDESRSHHTSPGDKYVVHMGEGETSRRVILYNSLPRQRTKIQSLIVTTSFVKVTDRTGKPVQCQISPIWMDVAKLSPAKFELSFQVTVPGFGLATYMIHTVSGTTLSPHVHVAKVTLYNAPETSFAVPGFTNVHVVSEKRGFSIQQTPELTASFTESGLLKAMRVRETTVPIHLEFVKYGTKSLGDKSGAYLFLPDKSDPDRITVPLDTVVHVTEGPLLSRVYLKLPYVAHTYTLYNSPSSDGLGLHVQNQVDISATSNFELAMRLNTGITSGDQFYTDLNGLNMVRRQRFSKLPTQGNYYPMPAIAYIEDEETRLTIATAQPLGVASMGAGQIEIMQDRRLMQDDNRGLGQGVLDNLLTSHLFTLVLEKRTSPCPNGQLPADHPAGFLSLGGHLVSQDLLHPIVALHPSSSAVNEFRSELSPLRFDLPVDIDVVSLRVFPVPEGAENGMGIVLHRQALSLCWGGGSLGRFQVSENGEIDLSQLLRNTEEWTMTRAPITFNDVGPELDNPVVSLCQHQILPILFHRAQS